jgi:hypothetical protein
MPASSSSPSSPPPSRSFLHDLVKQWTTIPGRKISSSTGSNSKEERELPGAPAEEQQQQEQRTLRLPDPTPTTPVGLKPRRSIASLKKSLDVVVAKGEEDEGSWGSAAAPHHHHPAAAATTMISSPVVSTRSTLYGSASATAFASMGQSPSGSSTTTATKSQQVAASPVLLPGRARTAVGALVAEAAAVSTSEHRREDRASTRSPLRGGVSTNAAETTTMTHGSANLLNQSLQSILPPFDDVDNYQYSGRSRRYGSHTHDRSGPIVSSGPPQPLFGTDEVDTDVALFRSVSSPDVVEAFRSPLEGGEAPKPRRLVSHPNMDVKPSGAPSPIVPRPPIESLSPVRRIGRHRNDKTSVVDNPPPSLSPMPSIVASPSSLAGAMHRPMPNHHRMDAESRDDYRDVDEFILDGDDSPDGFHSREYDDVGRDNFNPAERTFQKQKFSNQRQAHDDLILAALERLQDEHGLVAEIQRQLGQHDSEPSSSTTTESFLMGMSTETAQRISSTLVQILQELDVTEQLLFSSPSDAAAVAVPRNDFRDAIRFCLQLVRLSTTSSTAVAGAAGGTKRTSDFPQEMSKWRLLPEIKASLGLIPESPQVVHRGGDTSVFSVPCDDSVATPMTSNVSISTTITTRTHLTAGNNNNALSPGRHDPPPRFHHQALEVRHTIATIAALLDRMSRLLTRTDKLPTQEIKRVYLEMQTLDISALKCVVESFEIDQPESLLMLLSGSASQDDSLFDVPPPMTTNTTTTAVVPPPLVESVAQRQMPQDKFFSPILRSQSGNRPGEDTVSTSLAPKGAAAQQVEAKPRAAGRRGGGGGGSRRGNPFRRSTFKLQDPLNLA